MDRLQALISIERLRRDVPMIESGIVLPGSLLRILNRCHGLREDTAHGQI